MFSSFVRPKPCRILITLKNNDGTWHLSKIAKETQTTYVYVTHFMTRLEAHGFVTIMASGKKRIVKLTEKGMIAANSLDEIIKRFDRS
jgi:predicted transcriptional regulator